MIGMYVHYPLLFEKFLDCFAKIGAIGFELIGNLRARQAGQASEMMLIGYKPLEQALQCQSWRSPRPCG